MSNEDRYAKLSEMRSERIVPFVKHGKMVELGCGAGATLSVLSRHFPESMIIGLDVEEEMLEKVNRRNLRNVIPVKGDATWEIFPKSTFDTAIFKFSLHEIYSSLGDEGIEKALRNAYKILKGQGNLIIYDHVRPAPATVGIRIKEDIYKLRFKQFVEEFAPRRIECEVKGDWINLDISDCLEFLTKYEATKWEDEMREVHFFYTLEEFQRTLAKAQFSIRSIKKYRFEEDIWKEKTSIFDTTFENPECYVIIVSEKS